jgi:hypothetical protein
MTRSLVALAGLLLAAGLHPADALARGWCNADHGGSAEFRDEVRAGAGGFSSAMSQAWQSLAYIEADNFEGALKVAAALPDQFDSAGKSFRAAAEGQDESLARAVQAVDPSKVQGFEDLASPELREMLENVRSGQYGRLLATCADLGFGMSKATRALVEALKSNPASPATDRAIWNVLATMDHAIFLGWRVSAVFAAAGGRQ